MAENEMTQIFGIRLTYRKPLYSLCSPPLLSSKKLKLAADVNMVRQYHSCRQRILQPPCLYCNG
jgi:hypothetical protein